MVEDRPNERVQGRVRASGCTEGRAGVCSCAFMAATEAAIAQVRPGNRARERRGRRQRQSTTTSGQYALSRDGRNKLNAGEAAARTADCRNDAPKRNAVDEVRDRGPQCRALASVV